MSSLADTHIRPYALADAPEVWEAARESLAELQPWMPWCHPGYSIEESRSWLGVQVPAFQQGTSFEFAVVSADGRYLGGCGLNQIDQANSRANLGYWVRTSGFEQTRLVRLEVVIAIGNIASHRVAEKAGALREGTLRSRLLLHGTHHDATMFSFIRTERAVSSAPSSGPAAV